MSNWIVHKSWDRMDPKTDNMFEFANIVPPKDLSHIPQDVLEQWIYPFHNCDNSRKNYAWINYYNAVFELVQMPISFFIDDVEPMDFGYDLVDDLAKLKSYNNFYCTPDDRDYWQKFGTWKLPPVILDVSSLEDIPIGISYPSDYVLVEGHHRLGYLRAAAKMEISNVKSYHSLYLLKANAR